MLEDDPEGTSMRKFFHPLWKDKQQRGCGEKRAKKKEGGPPIPRRMTWTCASRPIFDIRDKTKQGIFSKVYIFSLDETSCFLSPRGGDPREDFSLFYRRNLWKKYLYSFFFRRYHAFSLLIVILCSSKNQYSEGSLFPWLSTPLWTCQSSVSLCVCVCTVNVTLPENHPLVLTYARLLITFPSPIRRGRQSDFVKDRRHRKTSGLSGPSI